MTIQLIENHKTNKKKNWYDILRCLVNSQNKSRLATLQRIPMTLTTRQIEIMKTKIKLNY